MFVSQWDIALASVERIAMKNLGTGAGNPFDPRGDCGAALATLATDGLLVELVDESQGQVPREYFAIHLPSLVEEISHDRRAVAASTRMCETLAGGVVVGVQHCASRIKVKGYVDEAGFVTSVVAKPYPHDDRICTHSDLPGPSWRRADVERWYDRYVQLGIGARVYGRAAELVPAARWKVGLTLSEFGQKVRAKLHRGDPWRWQFNGCEVCRGVVDWERAGEGDFPPH